MIRTPDWNWVAAGTIALVVGYGFDVALGLGVATNRGTGPCYEAGWFAFLPVVGGWINLGVAMDCGSHRGAAQFHVAGGVLQAAGLLTLILSAALQIERPPPEASLQLHAGAPAADIGVTLSVGL